jgi:hypothetical protein
VIHVPDLPSGTVTFLFTDIEGSTRLLRQLRDRYARATRSSSSFGAQGTELPPP